MSEKSRPAADQSARPQSESTIKSGWMKPTAPPTMDSRPTGSPTPPPAPPKSEK